MTTASPPRTTNSRRHKKVERYMSMMNSMRASVAVKLEIHSMSVNSFQSAVYMYLDAPESQPDSDAFHGGDTCFSDLVVNTLCKISRKGCSNRSSTFCGQTTGLKRILCLADGLLSDNARGLKTKQNKEKRNDRRSKCSERDELGCRQVRSEP
jgi:hypothetical protein